MSPLDGLIPGIVDAHLQQWNPRRTPWSANRLSRVYRYAPRLADRVFPFVVPKADRDYVLTPRTVARSYEPGRYIVDIAAVPPVAGVPIDTVVLVGAYWRTSGVADLATAEADGYALEEVRYALNLPFGTDNAPRLGAIVVHGNPRSEGFGDRLDRQRDLTNLVRGVRINATRHPDPRIRQGIDVDNVLTSADFLRGMEAVADRDLVAEVFLYSHQLYDVITLAREFPDTTIVVEHLGGPVGLFGPVGARTGATAAARADILRLWRERIVSLAARPNVMIKLSGLALPVLGYGRERSGNIGCRSTLAQMIGPLVEHVIAYFGASRVMFGSNYPVDKPNASIDMIVGALIDVASPWGDNVLRALFRENAVRTYRIDA
ncbi:hypothetical protein GCM10009624_26160 [Gordonia sinesedis]